MTIVDIYTDGGCEPNPGFGAWAAVICVGSKQTKLRGIDEETTNNRMELTAAIKALKALDEPSRITLYTDSDYVRRGMTDWIHRWIENDWYTASGNPVKNADLWRELYFVSARHRITWVWVRGHADNKMNNMVHDMVEELLEEEMSI